MGVFRRCAAASLGLTLFAMGEMVEAQVAPPAGALQAPPVGPPQPMTLGRFLGINQAAQRIRNGAVNRRGNTPGLERGLPLLPLNDPRNLESANPAIKKAAEVKLEEDLAPQKIKALKYLATVGCGCYPGVKEAFMAALDDCTEEVRYQAVKALIDAADEHCETCNRDCCCDEELTLKLAEMAYERDDKCCFKEPSERVREAAAEALRACCPGRGPVTPEMVPAGPATPPEVPLPRPEVPMPETPTTTSIGPQMETAIATDGDKVLLFGAPLEAVVEPAPVRQHTMPIHSSNATSPLKSDVHTPARPTGSQRSTISVHEAGPATRHEPAMESSAGVIARPTSHSRQVAKNNKPAESTIGRSTPADKDSAVLQVAVLDEPTEKFAPPPAAAPVSRGHARSTGKAIEGTVAKVAGGAGTVQIQLPRTSQAQVGQRVKVYHRYMLHESCLGELEVVAVGQSAVTARPLADCDLTKLASGDRAVLMAGAPAQTR